MGATPAAASTPVVCHDDSSDQNALSTALSGMGAGDTLVIDGLCRGHFTLPSSVTAGYTIEGEAGVTSGFDGGGIQQGGTVLSGTVDESSPATTVTLANLTFENITAPSSANPSVLRVDFVEGSLVLVDDTFTHNSNSWPDQPPIAIDDVPACSGQDTALTIENSTFSIETASGGGVDGAGLSLTDGCGSNAVTLNSDQFNADTLNAGGGDGLGGGLAILGSGTVTPSVTQTGDVFDGDTVVAGGGGNYGGAGEWTQGVNLASTRDRFTSDTLPGTTGAKWSWGAGIGILNSSCSASNPLSATLTEDVVAANTIADSGGDIAADAQGAGIYVGACTLLNTGESLTLADSTVSGNAVTPSGGVAGIDGGPSDSLTLRNTILDGDSGGAETGGFGTVSATYSDFCSGSSPYTGAGNICASPQLGGTFGVQESGASPTINAGSNALIPSGLTTDFFGEARINTPTASCSVNTNVDIGAVQYGPVCETSPPPPPIVPLTLTGVGQSHTKWREGSTAATIARRRRHRRPDSPLGTTFSFTLSTQANVTLTFKRPTVGRAVGAKCVPTTWRNRHARKCTYIAGVGRLTFPTVPAGAHTVTFDGVLQNGRRLRAAFYQVAIAASTSSASVAPQTLSFRIARR